MTVEHEVRVARSHASSTAVRFTDHALLRLAQRAWQLESAAAAAERLDDIVVHGYLTPIRPAWLSPRTRCAQIWLELGDLVFPLVTVGDALLATTCLARGERCDDEARPPRARARRIADRRREHERRHTARLERSA